MKTEAHWLAAALLGAAFGITPLARAADATPSTAPDPATPAAPAAATPAAPPSTEAVAPETSATTSQATAPATAEAAPVARAPSKPAAAATASSAPNTSSAPNARDDTDAPDDRLMGSHQLHSYAQLGLRSTLVTDAGFDPFSTNDVTNHFSVTLGRVLIAQDNVSFGLGAGWDYSHDGASVRGSPTSLDVHRLTLVPEARYHFARRFYGFGRIGAGVSLLDATLERSGDYDSSTNDVAFSADASAGVAWEVIGERTGDSRQPRMWLIADAGYLFTTKADLLLDSAPDAPARASTTSLGELGLSGFTYRVTAALTY